MTLHFNLCKILNHEDAAEDIFYIGPYLLDSDPVDYTHIVEINHLPLLIIQELENFYSTLPVFPDFNTLENELLTLLDFFYPGNTFSLNAVNTVDYFTGINATQVEYNYDKPFSISKVEKS